MPVKNADNNNITTPARTAKFCVRTHFADMDYRGSQEDGAFMASPHDLHILYSNIKEKYGGQSRGLGRIKVFAQIHLPFGYVEVIIFTIAEAGTSKMITSILAPPLHLAHLLLRSLVLVCDLLGSIAVALICCKKFFTTNFLLLLFLSLHLLQLAQSA